MRSVMLHCEGHNRDRLLEAQRAAATSYSALQFRVGPVCPGAKNFPASSRCKPLRDGLAAPPRSLRHGRAAGRCVGDSCS